MDPQIREVNVRAVKRIAYCPDCNLELEQGPNMMLSNPPQYQYFCPQCGYGYITTERFPLIDFVEISPQ